MLLAIEFSSPEHDFNGFQLENSAVTVLLKLAYILQAVGKSLLSIRRTVACFAQL